MTLWNRPDQFGTVTRLMHWISALGVLMVAALGLWVVRAPMDTPDAVTKTVTLFSWHKSLGVLLLGLALLRGLLAALQPRPSPVTMHGQGAAHVVQAALYGVLILLPASGLVLHLASAGLAPLLWPGADRLPDLSQNTGLADTARRAHHALGLGLAALLALHLGGAVWHAARRDGTVARMTLGRRIAGHASPRMPWPGLAVIALALAGLVLLSGPAPVKEPQRQATSGNWLMRSGDIAITFSQFETPVTGRMTGFDAIIEFTDNPAPVTLGAVTVEMPMTGLDLGAVTAQALGPDFFDATTHPTARFEAEIRRAADGYVAEGVLRLRDMQRPLRLPFALSITGDMAELRATTVLDRRDFGLGLQLTDPAQLGFDVQIEIRLTAEKRAVAP